MGASNVCCALTVANGAHPQFEISGPVVMPNSVNVMHGLMLPKLSSQLPFHKKSMLADAASVLIFGKDVAICGDEAVLDHRLAEVPVFLAQIAVMGEASLERRNACLPFAGIDVLASWVVTTWLNANFHASSIPWPHENGVKAPGYYASTGLPPFKTAAPSPKTAAPFRAISDCEFAPRSDQFS